MLLHPHNDNLYRFVSVQLRAYSRQVEAKEIKEQAIKDQRINDKHQRKFPLSLGVNWPQVR